MLTPKALLRKHPKIREALDNWVKLQGNVFVESGGVLVSGIGSGESYGENFGLQWNRFRTTQLDSQTHAAQTEVRLFSGSGWSGDNLRGKTVLEIGAGAGRFTEVLLRNGAIVVAVDISQAVFANAINKDCSNLLLIQSDFRFLEGMEDSFDFVLAYGVAHHVPDPGLLYEFSVRSAKPGGKIAVDHYDKRLIPSSYYHPKYLWRPITVRVEPKTLLSYIEWYIPIWIRFDTAQIKIWVPWQMSCVASFRYQSGIIGV
jgi:SAM-dependent methyltransferase